MGAYLYFKTTESNVEEVYEYLVNQNQLNGKLFDKWDEQMITIGSKVNVEWAETERPDLVEMMISKLGKGDIKTGHGISSNFAEAGYDESDLLEMWTTVFGQLNAKYGMKYYANSCAFSKDEHYFSLEQMKRITNNGALLSGKTSKNENTLKKYDELHELLSATIFDISIVKEKDKILIDGDWLGVKDHYGTLSVKEKGKQNWDYTPIEKLSKKIREHKKYVPKIRFDGAVIDVEAYVLDGGCLVYLETIGAENMVKSVTSVLMQGRLKMNESTIDASFGQITINTAGNRRKIIDLENGLAHAITYHSPSIADSKFDILVGEDKEKLRERFESWLNNTNFLPYPHELIESIYKELVDREKMVTLRSFGIEALKIDATLLEDDAHDLQEIILGVCKSKGLIDENAKPLKPSMPLPKSHYLKDRQVEKIFDTLNGMPKTYELEDMKIKPVGLKLFSPNMTLYITEADKGSDEDKYEGMQTQCYGYVKNEDYPMGEWGYISVRDYLEVVYPNGGGFEQDLYFEDMYINSNGRVGTKQELEELSKEAL